MSSLWASSTGYSRRPQAYAAAGEVIDAVADRLRSSGSAYFFGSSPSSLDALLVGHLMYYRSSPAAAPVLADKVRLGGSSR